MKLREDVTLRPTGEDDLVTWDRFCTEPDVAGPFQWNGFLDPRAARQRWADDGFLGKSPYHLAVARDGAPAGAVMWMDHQYFSDVWEIGVTILPEHRGHGVGLTAHRLLVDYLFDHTTAHRLHAITDAANEPEQRTLARCGFRQEGHLREAAFRAGTWHDVLMYGLLRSEHH